MKGSISIRLMQGSIRSVKRGLRSSGMWPCEKEYTAYKREYSALRNVHIPHERSISSWKNNPNENYASSYIEVLKWA